MSPETGSPDTHLSSGSCLLSQQTSSAKDAKVGDTVPAPGHADSTGELRASHTNSRELASTHRIEFWEVGSGKAEDTAERKAPS